MKQTILSCTVIALAITGCMGSDRASMETPLHYSNTAAPRHSYAPYESRSHIHLWALERNTTEVYIGGDLGPRESLRHVATTDNGIRYFIGASRDGVGVDRLRNYEKDLRSRSGGRFTPYRVQPFLYFDPDLLKTKHAGIALALADSIRILNDALPPEFQIVVAGRRTVDAVYPGEIMVNLETPASVGTNCGSGAVACAAYGLNASKLYLPDDFDTSEYSYPRSVIIHELLHALGIRGHVDSIEFPDSIMGTAGEFIPNLGHILSKIDREILQIMYMSQRTDLYNDWGEWSDTTHHLVGRSEDEALNFGVALFNGLPQPWAKGVLPRTDLADNRLLSGTATWSGNLLGYSGSSPIAGDAELQVRLSTLTNPEAEQDLRFRDIFFLNRFESSSPDRWFPTRNIDYKVVVNGNGFNNVLGESYEQGLVTGAFLGPRHEHMGGTVKRTDMVGAFGGSR